MMLISFMLRPLVLFVEATCPGVTIRVLADDILVTQEGDDAMSSSVLLIVYILT